MERIIAITTAMPPTVSVGPDACHLGFEINFGQMQTEAAIDGAFDFIRDDSLVGSCYTARSVNTGTVQGIRVAIGGEMLVRCSTLTQAGGCGPGFSNG